MSFNTSGELCELGSNSYNLSNTWLFVYTNSNLFQDKVFKDLQILRAVLVIYVVANTNQLSSEQTNNKDC